ncbi:MAG: ABC transporter permease [Firmicutes bacterium HGW-Firmicutes-7]|nr:MAG: ABC transporter permease [Firmicutes bacterium HGW-Firmicutes-7]
MKKIGAVILLITMCLGLIGSTSGCKKEETRELNFFNWTEYMPQELIDKFQKETGIKVNYSTYSSNEEMYAKVTAAPGVYDMVVATDYMVDIMVKQSMLEEINKDNIAKIGNYGAAYMDQSFDPGNVYTLPYMAGSVLMVYNKTMIDKPIETYADFWDESLKDNTVVLDDQRAIIGMALKKLGYSINETDEAILALAVEELKTLKRNIKAFDSDSPKSLLISGEVAAGYVWSAEAVLAQNENSNLVVVIPEEGTYLFQDNFAIPKGAKNKDEAEAFINFMLDPENGKVFSESRPYSNPNAAVLELLSEDMKNNKAVYPPDSFFEVSEFVLDLGETTLVYDEMWTKFKQE